MSRSALTRKRLLGGGAHQELEKKENRRSRKLMTFYYKGEKEKKGQCSSRLESIFIEKKGGAHYRKWPLNQGEKEAPLFRPRRRVPVHDKNHAQSSGEELFLIGTVSEKSDDPKKKNPPLLTSAGNSPRAIVVDDEQRSVLIVRGGGNFLKEKKKLISPL